MHKIEVELAASDASIFRWVARHPGAFWLDGQERKRASFMGFAPEAQLEVGPDGRCARRGATGAGLGADEPLRAISAFVEEAGTRKVPHVVGLLAYDLGPLAEPRIAARRNGGPPLPRASLARYPAVLELEAGEGEAGRARGVAVHARSAAAAAALGDALSAAFRDGAVDAAGVPATRERSTCGPAGLLEAPQREIHRRAVRRALEAIAAGDVYQVNLAQRFLVRSPLPASEAYVKLRAVQPVPHGVYLDAGAFRVLCNSPERFLRVAGERIETEPIKGTRARDPVPERDRALRSALCRDPKERAEHVMIVDLERSDLGRVCATGSIEVPSLMRIDSFASVHHMASTVRGRLRGEVDLAAILRAAFPGGSVTGAPKIRATQVIAELERAPRGLYTGAIAWFRGPRDFDSAIAIRTAVERDGVYAYHAGGGIVADSDPDREFEECWLKAKPFLEALLGAEERAALEREVGLRDPLSPGAAP